MRKGKRRILAVSAIAAIAAIAAMALTSCGVFLPTKPSLDVSEFKTSCNENQKVLIVMLPGRFDSPKDLEKHGFVDAVKRRGINADIAIPDLHFGYYLARTVTDRLHEDVVLPARQGRYAQIWFAGISLGGLGSLLYNQYHPGMVDDMVLIAPFLGSDDIHREIAGANGVRGWQAGEIKPDDYERRLWAWIKEYGDRVAVQPEPVPRVYLGFGLSDRFAASNRLFASVLPPSRVMTVDGGHDWLPWLRIWEDFLDRKALPRACHQP